MLGWCVGGAVGGSLGGPEGAALGCLGGALGVALSSFFDSIADDFYPYDDHLFEGGGEGDPTLGGQGSNTPRMYDHLREKLQKDPPP